MRHGFTDRTHAGEELAGLLGEHARDDDVVVLGLPRGGVPVAAVVASRLDAPLDVIVVRKVGAPDQPELALGAVAAGGVFVRNARIEEHVGIDDAHLARLAGIERRRVQEQEALFRGGAPPQPVEGRTVIVVDDGIATGATARAALEALRTRGPAHLVLAVPVAPHQAVDQLEPFTDEIVCVLTPHRFGAVGRWYSDFRAVPDGEVIRLLG